MLIVGADMSQFPPKSRFPLLAWGSLLFNLGVIVWGAYVRASGSGAGCGSHWPLCNGEILPDTGLSKTAIEFAHRITSGGCLILAVAIAWLGVRRFPRGYAVRQGAIAVLGFTLAEALIGAGLVLLRYVEQDQSVGRVLSICLHLCNTFLLLAAISLTAWWSSYSPQFRIPRRVAGTPLSRSARFALISVAGTLLLGVTGAVTALGDTLFPATSLAQGMSQDFGSASHFLLRLRVIHPFLALLAGAWLFYFSEVALETQAQRGVDSARRVSRLALGLKALVVLQLGVGMVNLLFLAPIPLQLIHLGVAEVLWVVLTLLAAHTVQKPEGASS